ncbi:MAG: hypothetical protein ACK5MT_18065 [Actinomycetales bacterium]
MRSVKRLVAVLLGALVAWVGLAQPSDAVVESGPPEAATTCFYDSFHQRESTDTTTVYNFQVESTHTYYALAGITPILVHNANYNPNHAANTAGRVSGPLWTATKSKSAAVNALSHFNRHRADFPHLNNSLEYVAEAQGFLRKPGTGVWTRTRINGDVVRYDPGNNKFGVMDLTGAPKTYFRPDPASHGYSTNLDYFNAQ